MIKRGREDLGFPGWREVCDWLDESISASEPGEVLTKQPAIKNSEIPRLNDYSVAPDKSFWLKFPKKELPSRAETSVNISAFSEEVNNVRSKMTITEKKRADRAISDLTNGTEAYHMSALPPMNSVNAKSAVENGELLTDTIATWIKKGFVAGPFDSPPMPGFCANPLGVVTRNGKIRPILNMSGPKGASFNDNVDRPKL